jgi:osmotically-inducible protein OsmY
MSFTQVRSTGGLFTRVCLWGAVLACLFLLTVLPAAHGDTFSVRREYFAALDREKDFGAYEIEVDARFGKVILSGNVASEKSRIRAEEIALATEGVSSVENRLEVSSELAKRPHETISPLAGKVREAVLARSDLGSLELSVTSLEGRVTLAGVAASARDKEEIEKTAASVAGVVHVSSAISVRPSMSDAAITAAVEEALRTHQGVSMEGLDISTSSGVVTVRGLRPDHRERDLILSIALNVRGVKDIRSELR